MIEHGGNVAAAAARYGIAPEVWLDLSTGISPFAYPIGPIGAQAWRRLPAESAALRRAAAAYYGSDGLLAVPGSQAAIQLLPRLIGARRVALVQPSYAEHAAAWRRAGATVEVVDEDRIEAEGQRFDTVVLCNPNNPTGRLRRRAALAELLARMRARGGWLVLDEAFIDTRPQESLAPLAGDPGLAVLRSLGKFFGLAGARVGFLFGPAALLERAREALGPWPLAGPSLAAASAALADSAFQADARARLAQAAARLARLLERHGLRVAGASDFFAWTLHAGARALAERLARQAILVRAFDVPASLRFGLPGAETEWQRLEAALASL